MHRQHFRLFTLAVLSLIFLLPFATADKGWSPIHWKDLPLADDGDVIEVHQLIAPLFKVRFGDFFAKLKLFHMGLGFVNRRTREEWLVDYNALPTFEDSVFPAIQENGGKPDLVWQNYGGALLYNNINRTYWSIDPFKVVGYMTGADHNSFIEDYLPTFNATHPFYVPLDVYSKWSTKNPQKRDLLLKGYTCSDFLWETFDKLHEHGARFNCTVPARKNTMLFHGRSVEKVDYEDTRHHSKIIDFYRAVVFKFKNMTIVEAMRTIWSLFVKGNAYLRHGETYYHVQLKLPYFSWHYHEEALPGCP